VGHDHHFLERLDRAPREHVEFALGLYRDHEAVRYVLRHLRVAPSVKRVALSLDAGERGPWAVVARDGAFVTCLGVDMSTGSLPIVGRARLDALLAKHRDQRARDSTRDLETRANEPLAHFFRRLYRRADALTREEFVALSSVQPLIGDAFFQHGVESASLVLDQAPLLRGIDKPRGADLERARLVERNRWLAGHMILLASMGDRLLLDAFVRVAAKLDGSLTANMTVLASNTLALRAAWAAARVGKALLPGYRARASRIKSFVDALDVALPVLAIGLRHGAARDDARRILAALHKSGNEGDPTCRDLCAEHALAVLDGAVTEAKALDVGREIFISMTRHLPEGDPYRYAEASAVPDDLAMTTALEFDGFPWDKRDIVTLFAAATFLGRARAEDFYFPREVVTRVIVETTPEEIAEYVWRLDATVALAPSTVHRAPKPGRNDPCSCGSGEKFKRCCGA
jgi:hypothetical protein